MHERRIKRLQALIGFLRKGNQPTFEELQAYLSEVDKPLKTRQLREDLRFLREEGLDGTPLHIKMKGFRYVLENGKQFDYSNLLDSERYTLPLVFAALSPFERFPSVRAILDNLIKTHRLNRKEVRQMSAAIGTHMSPLNDLFVDRIISIMQAIHQETAVEFHYYKVAEGAIAKGADSVVYRCVYPLQIRVFEGRYYLVGLREGREALPREVEHFPIDRIHRRVDLAMDEESGDFKLFSWEAMSAKVQLDRLYAHRVGMYREFGVEQQPEWIYRWFRGWAASYVQAVPIHPTQEIVQQEGGDIRIRLQLIRTPDLENVFRKFGEFSWE